MATIYLLRHSDTEYTHLKLICGVSDPPLSNEGKVCAQNNSGIFSAHRFDRVFSSPAQRCTMTLNVMAPGYEYDTDVRLREIDFGELEGLPIKEVFHENTDQPGTYYDDWQMYHFPCGDNIVEYFRRAGDTVLAYADRPENAILLVTHNGFINSVIANLVMQDIRQLFTVPCHTCDMVKLWRKNGQFFYKLL